MSKKIKLSILGISYTQIQAGAYALIFAEENGVRRLPIVVGAPEAQSIAIVMEGVRPARPLSHDLIFSIFKELQIELIEALIYKFEDGAFFAELLLRQNNREFRFDSRTSDAIALALRANAPIYTTEEIMKNMAVVFHEPTEEQVKIDNAIKEDALAELQVDALKSRLGEALKEEDYELAIRLRDEINRRGND